VNYSIDLVSSSRLVVEELLSVKQGERVALVTDAMTPPELSSALAGAVKAVGAEYAILEMPLRELSRNNELPEMVARALEAADCLIGLTATSGAPTYSRVTKRLLDERSLRVMSMVMRPLETLTGGGALADYKALRVEGELLAAFWRQSKEVHLRSRAGTDLRADLSGVDVVVECGYADKPGMEAAFSDGEVSSRPREGTANGTLVIDGPIAHLGAPTRPLTLTVEDGSIVKIEGGDSAARALQEIVESVPNARNIAEIGVGLNGSCRRNGLFEEEKKGRGNVHVAIGDNIFYGGTVESPVHIDMVAYDTTVEFDTTVVVRDGAVDLDAARAALDAARALASRQ
jgi:leucyl aminopeptidase (aminopeptidase T)